MERENRPERPARDNRRRRKVCRGAGSLPGGRGEEAGDPLGETHGHGPVSWDQGIKSAESAAEGRRFLIHYQPDRAKCPF